MRRPAERVMSYMDEAMIRYLNAGDHVRYRGRGWTVKCARPAQFGQHARVVLNSDDRPRGEIADPSMVSTKVDLEARKAEQERPDCPVCNGTGMHKRAGKCRHCLGKGWVRAKKNRGEA